ncbi:hypothetical protein F5148DRAFT_1146135 [Russula earlei]|uniref:Uncharacterized protein n=1 Tax=Russula earlei TaxID=71964 RepID=A0ACC0ULN8_9AGAM|nr:hypothetical protein F5148DRAFT_1146135 [Russula earlei]
MLVESKRTSIFLFILMWVFSFDKDCRATYSQVDVYARRGSGPTSGCAVAKASGYLRKYRVVISPSSLDYGCALILSTETFHRGSSYRTRCMAIPVGSAFRTSSLGLELAGNETNRGGGTE